MEVLKLIIRNVFRHRLRATLTILGVAIAMLAFAILRTLVEAWYVGVESSAPDRLITRNKISLIYALPLAYKNRIQQVPGVTAVAYGTWYGGVYKDKKNFFPQFAISGAGYLDMYPEFLLSDEEKKAFEKDRNAAIAGRTVVERFGWKIGDVIPLQGAIFPVNVELVLKGIYRGARKNVDQTALFFRWDYLNESFRKTVPERADKVGWYLIRIKDPDRSAEISEEVDSLFRNSLAETLTETEKAFQMGFVAMTEAIVAAVRIISVVVIAIILIVLANTMAMTARERWSEYAVLKTLGFRPRFISVLIAGESLAISMIGGTIGALLSFPGGMVFQKQLESFLPVFEVTYSTILMIFLVSLVVGLFAALIPAVRVSRMGIAEGLRHIG
ncbi:MAG: FtsX-like permease family protein [Desulfomonile tiedjei]|uniref:FtsX-like permease family protein n=1 Tax=Desulfomonile tiedjei TaxID=2358 RepID=A0A9D6V1F0_9BACT|nr:FtsX-like permease family protein [Desulfomonile tiedjei]